jgi:uncharacterized membrane protein (UPF0127 family)
MSRPHFLSAMVGADAGAFVLQHERTGRVVAAEVELAADSKSRRKGLLGRDAMSPDSALIIAPCNAVHTFFMRFPIDVVFTDRSGQVLRVRRGTRPWRLALWFGAFATIELPEGTSERLGLATGDRIVVVRKSM